MAGGGAAVKSELAILRQVDNSAFRMADLPGFSPMALLAGDDGPGTTVVHLQAAHAKSN